METKNELGDSGDSGDSGISPDKQFTRTKVNAITRNTEKTIIKELANNIINEFNTFIHSTDCVSKHRWEYTFKCHVGVISLILNELRNYFEDDMVNVIPTGDPHSVSILVFW